MREIEFAISSSADDTTCVNRRDTVLESLRWSNFDEIRTYGDLFCADPPRKGPDGKFTE